MSLKQTLVASLEIINNLLKASSSIESSSKPHLVPDLKLMLLTFKAKIEDLFQGSLLSSLNYQITSTYYSKTLDYLKVLSDDSSEWKGFLKEHHEDNIKIYTTRLFTILEYFESVASYPPDDLFALDKTDPRWLILSQSAEFHHLDKREKIMKKYSKLFTKIASSLAYINKKGHKKHTKKNIMMLGLGSLYFMMQKQKALRKAHLLNSTPKLETVTYLLNILETKSIRKLSKIIMKKIKFDEVFYFPRVVSHVLEVPSLLEVSPKYETNPMQDMSNHVMVRLLSNQRFPSFYPHKKLVIHVHGGGFVTMSSASHQVYTNHWAEDLKVPVFSIDYRLAPAHPFPAALDDVWQVWNWLFHFGQSQLGVQLEDYVIVGDSAGGNLALALTYLILKHGMHPPKGIVLPYPALNLDKDFYSPSLLHALEDLLVPHTFLKLCLESYLGNWQDVHHPLISPGLMEKEILERLPPIRIMVGTEDPFHDECWRFTEKLLNIGKDVKLSIFSGASHGGLNFCFKGGIKESLEMVKKASDWMKVLLNLD